MLLTLLTAALVFLVYYISRSLLITVLGAVAVILILRSLRPVFANLENKFFPKPAIGRIRETESAGAAGRGLRVLVVSEHTDFDPGDSLKTALYDRIVADAVKELRRTKPVFDLRYGYAAERQLPVHYAYCTCGEKNSGMRRCFSAWLKAVGAKDFGTWKKDSEFFIYDGVFTDPETGTEQSSAVLFLLDSTLPKKSSEAGSGMPT